MKKCTGCNENKELDCFSNKPRGKFGKQSRCKKCNAEYAKKRRLENPGYAAKIQAQYRKKNPGRSKEYSKKCWADPEKRKKNQEKLKEWKLKNPDHYKNWYWTSEKGRPKKLLYRKEWVKKNPEYAKNNLNIQKIRYPEKHKARSILRTAVHQMKIVKPKVCQSCMKEKNRIEGHHEDYNKPLEVIWLCVGCHKKLHMKGVYT